jgi:hypothetical protein
VQGIQGPKGDPGADGAQGPQGPQGIQGPAGVPGSGTGDMLAANNLSELTNKTTARANLVLGNVDNTSDVNKPVSTAQQSALDAKLAKVAADLTGWWAISSVLTPAAIAANMNDYAPAGIQTCNVLRINSSVAVTVTGLIAPSPSNGRVLVIQNAQQYPITLTHNDAASAAANRFYFPDLQPHTLLPADNALFFYDIGSGGFWRPLVQFPSRAASAATIMLATDAQQHVTPQGLWAISAVVAVAFAANQVLDFNAGLNFDIAAATANFTLAIPNNVKVGQSGRIRIPQDATGGRIITYAAGWKGPGGAAANALSTAANAVDILYYYVRGLTEVEYSLAKAFA